MSKRVALRGHTHFYEMKPGKTYKRFNSFSEFEIKVIQESRHIPTKDILHLLPGRSIAVISYLRAKTGAYRIFKGKHDATVLQALLEKS